MKKIILFLSILSIVACHRANDVEKNFQQAVTAIKAEHFLEAMKILVPLAEKGHAPSQTILAGLYIYAQKIGVPRDETKAFYWTKLAAEQNYAPAFSQLAGFYRSGVGTEKNEEEALKWYKKGADAGDLASQQILARYNQTHEF